MIYLGFVVMLSYEFVCFFLEEVLFLSLIFILLRWIWINVSGRSILSSLLPG
jgi:hypothetical protein